MDTGKSGIFSRGHPQEWTKKNIKKKEDCGETTQQKTQEKRKMNWDQDKISQGSTYQQCQAFWFPTPVLWSTKWMKLNPYKQLLCSHNRNLVKIKLKKHSKSIHETC